MPEFTLISHLTPFGSFLLTATLAKGKDLLLWGKEVQREEPLGTSRPPLADRMAAFPLFSGVALWSVRGADVFGEHQSYPSGPQSQLKVLYEG